MAEFVGVPTAVNNGYDFVNKAVDRARDEIPENKNRKNADKLYNIATNLKETSNQSAVPYSSTQREMAYQVVYNGEIASEAIQSSSESKNFVTAVRQSRKGSRHVKKTETWANNLNTSLKSDQTQRLLQETRDNLDAMPCHTGMSRTGHSADSSGQSKGRPISTKAKVMGTMPNRPDATLYPSYEPKGPTVTWQANDNLRRFNDKPADAAAHRTHSSSHQPVQSTSYDRRASAAANVYDSRIAAVAQAYDSRVPAPANYSRANAQGYPGNTPSYTGAAYTGIPAYAGTSSYTGAPAYASTSAYTGTPGYGTNTSAYTAVPTTATAPGYYQASGTVPYQSQGAGYGYTTYEQGTQAYGSSRGQSGSAPGGQNNPYRYG